MLNVPVNDYCIWKCQEIQDLCKKKTHEEGREIQDLDIAKNTNQTKEMHLGHTRKLKHKEKSITNRNRKTRPKRESGKTGKSQDVVKLGKDRQHQKLGNQRKR